MLSVGFEPMTPALERAKAVHVLDSVATVIGFSFLEVAIFFSPG
jgi:hypothetical protein